MGKIECSICNHSYDDTVHRPRVLPCGHGFCTSCIEESISRGNKTCLVCREEHGVDSAADFPVNFSLEELLHEKNASLASQKSNSDSSFEIEISGMCQKHAGIPQYFYCKSHKEKVCHSCVVIDHPPITCNLISLEGEIKEKKQSQILRVKDRKQDLVETEKDFGILLKRGNDYLSEKNNKKQELENEVQVLRKKLEQIKKEIGNKEKYQTQIKKAINECQKKQQCFDVMEYKLKSTKTNQEIVNQCKSSETEIQQIQKWEENQRRTLNMMKVSEEPNKYAQVTRNGIQRSSKIFSEVGRTFIPSLTKDLIPPSNALIIKEAELSLSSDTTTVFMDLSGNGHHLGRIYLRIFSSTRLGQQFIILALGTSGDTFKGTKFAELNGKYIFLKQYVTEKGHFSDKAHMSLKKEENPGIELRGRIFIKYSSFSFSGPTVSFEILRGSYSKYKEWGYIGDIISGMDIVDRALEEYAKEQISSTNLDLSDISITECGIVLNY